MPPTEDHPDRFVMPAPHHHRDIRGGGARAAIFGVSDGLVTNVSLVLGIAGASPGGGVVRLAGIAGLVAGSFSMAAGEYLSMAAQRELMERELEVERKALSRSPLGEANELRGMYERRGIDPAVAQDMVEQVHLDPDLALETHAREELGINPQQLGSPVQAALASFFTFALGAFIPLLPWLYSKGTPAIIASVVLGVVASLMVGIVLAAFTERPVIRSALRQLTFTVLAAAVTYGVGRAIGTGVG
ncbi:MAG TPA: VIT1/CCC1 transporter family protein [Acidimicrobiales bacterium]|jgi:VIT1/CCC1 family predicted Fe2+/Mn2+ transporter|nr:VIT1/CCC1 transporter family protein [Acidimicrobiales bacterium]